ncbi:MAG: hemerythrin domain-containing protein, partial [Polyangiaceae bacterium]|nr:hemerythrin domain-containing protein [Polyangiaceae bacterium]
MRADSPGAHFTPDHRHCDELWAQIEEVADDPKAAAERYGAFDRAMRRHFAMEEEVLFPALEDATGMHGGGPTHVMRMEHAQMKRMLDEMTAAVERGDVSGALDQGDTLLMLIQQHNVKEEGILYPMCDSVLTP